MSLEQRGIRSERAVFQPVAVIVFLMTGAWLGVKGTWTVEARQPVCDGLAMSSCRNLVGLKLFGRINEAGFRKIVLALLLLSGAALMF